MRERERGRERSSLIAPLPTRILTFSRLVCCWSAGLASDLLAILPQQTKILGGTVRGKVVVMPFQLNFTSAQCFCQEFGGVRIHLLVPGWSFGRSVGQ